MKRLIVVALILAVAALVAMAMPPPSDTTTVMTSYTTPTISSLTQTFATDIGGCTANGIVANMTAINPRAGGSYLCQVQPFIVPETMIRQTPEGLRLWRNMRSLGTTNAMKIYDHQFIARVAGNIRA